MPCKIAKNPKRVWVGFDEQSRPVQVLLEEPSVALVHAVQPAGLDEHARPLHVFEEEVDGTEGHTAEDGLDDEVHLYLFEDTQAAQ